MNSIALFGATGKTGKVLLNNLISRNYHVKVLVRNPDRLSLSHPKLEVLKGDVLNESDVLMTIQGTDAIINVIGHVKSCPPDLQTRATKNILRGMQQIGISRLINLTGGGVTTQGDNPRWPDRFIAFIMKNLAGQAIKNRFTDGIEHVRIIKESPVDWTIVRAPLLLDRPVTGKTRVGMVGHIPGYSLTYGDLAREIIQILEENSYIHQLPYFTNG